MEKSKSLKLLFILLLMTFITDLIAQEYEWAKKMGGYSNTFPNSIAVDTSGNVYTTGTFYGTSDFDPGSATENLYSSGVYDIFISKFDSNGNFVWVKQFGGNGLDIADAISIDSIGNIYTTGYFDGSVDFDPGTGTSYLTSVGGYDLFISKLDTDGNFIWAKRIGNNGIYSVKGRSLEIDNLGNLIIAGSFSETVDFDPGEGVTNLTPEFVDIFICKLDVDGNFLWARHFEGPAEENLGSIATDFLGNIYATGYFSGSVDFNPGIEVFNLTSAGFNDIFICKLDKDGTFVWGKNMGGTESDRSSSISTDFEGNVYTTGVFEETADFDPGNGSFNLTSVGSGDVFISKLDTNGDFVWAKGFGSIYFDFGASITNDIYGNIYSTGYFRETVDFDPGEEIMNLTTIGWEDAFISKLDVNGEFVWTKQIGGQGSHVSPNKIVIDNSGNIITTGVFDGDIDCNPGTGVDILTHEGDKIAFVHKMKPCNPTYGVDTQYACNFYTWIDGITYTTSNNTTTHYFSNELGCDSIVTLDLTLDTVNVMTTLSDFLISANAFGATYNWLDCNNNYEPFIGEINQDFLVTINGDYAVEVSENGCTDTSACITISTVNIDETIKLHEDIDVYPIPNSGLVNFDLKNLRNVTISVYNAIGEKIYSLNQINNQFHQINLNVESGIYIIEVFSDEGKEVIRLIVK